MKYGETYENLAKNIEPYLRQISDGVYGQGIKYGESCESLARNIKPYLTIPRYNTACSMLLYPQWWNTTVTIYNRYEAPDTNLVTWYRNVLDNCFMKNTGNKVTVGQTSLETNNIIVRIPENKRFAEYGQWINLSDDEKQSCFTLRQGDIVVRGEVGDEINEYQAGRYSNDLLKRYKEIGVCFIISAYQNNTGSGRGTPHYYVSGE